MLGAALVLAVLLLQPRGADIAKTPSKHEPPAIASDRTAETRNKNARSAVPNQARAVAPELGILKAAPDPGLAAPPQALRHRWIAVAPDLFTAKRSPFWAPKGQRHFVLNLFPDVALPVTIDRAEAMGNGLYTAEGAIDGRPGSRVLFAMAGDALSASVFDPVFGSYSIEGAAPGKTIVYEIDPNYAAVCGGPKLPFLDQDAMQEISRRQSALKDGSGGSNPTIESYQDGTPVIDVMIVYSSETLQQAGQNAVDSKIALAFLEANAEFARSGIAARLRMVHSMVYNFTESGNFDSELEALRKTDDGVMDDIHAIRDQYGADLVSLVVLHSDSQTVGQAYLLSTPWSASNNLFGFSIILWGSFTGTNTFSHEIGHNLGCAHDRQNASGPGAYSYSYGYRFLDSTNTQWRTIMAYVPGQRSGYFSNPRLTSPPGIPGDVPLGVPADQPGESDNARTIDQSAFEVASYRLRADTFATGNLINVSTRALVGSGSRQLIGGFYISGPPKTVVVRAIGPSLSAYGVPNVLLDPQLQVVPFGESTPIATNDDWANAANADELQATSKAPGDPREAALLLTLPQGGYTVLASGKDGTTGIGLVEVYEQTRSGNRITNLSTRGWVDTGYNVMIGGFVVEGNAGETKRIVIRVLGPTLENYNVPNAMFDPAARLYNAQSELLLDNDDWDFGPNQGEIKALGYAPGNRREPCMIIDLAPGAYTVIARPFENPAPDGIQPGVGLIEVYEINEWKTPVP